MTLADSWSFKIETFPSLEKVLSFFFHSGVLTFYNVPKVWPISSYTGHTEDSFVWDSSLVLRHVTVLGSSDGFLLVH